MKKLISTPSPVLVGAFLALVGAPAAVLASAAPTPITGTVSTLTLGDTLVVDGKTYPVLKSPRTELKPWLKVGDQVDVLIGVPAANKSPGIIAITRHSDAPR